MKKIIILIVLLALFILGCEIPLNSKYHFDNPVNCFDWIINNFDFEVTGYKSPMETLEIRKGDCFTLSLFFCEIMQDKEPEIVVGYYPSEKQWHAISKIDNTYFDITLTQKITTKNPFPGHSFSIPWRLAKGYKFYANFVE
jgi:hypothetical protein